MMIDNSIIVIDNITQHIERGHPLHEACIKGTNEVIRPLISSVLTTCAVFVPLIFLSGIAGALFYDQAIAVASGLAASLVVSITLIPTLYYLVHSGRPAVTKAGKKLLTAGVQAGECTITGGLILSLNTGSWHWQVFFAAAVAGGLFTLLPLQKMPPLRQTETVMKIDWNENIHLDENLRRVSSLMGPQQGADCPVGGIYRPSAVPAWP
jgi:multidrug efflux pump subunit AcrB